MCLTGIHTHYKADINHRLFNVAFMRSGPVANGAPFRKQTVQSEDATDVPVGPFYTGQWVKCRPFKNDGQMTANYIRSCGEFYSVVMIS